MHLCFPVLVHPIYALFLLVLVPTKPPALQKQHSCQSLRKVFLTCNASSLVGVIISALSGLAPFFFTPVLGSLPPFIARPVSATFFSLSSICSSRCRMGSPKARVLPEPVSAAPTRSCNVGTHGQTKYNNWENRFWMQSSHRNPTSFSICSSLCRIGGSKAGVLPEPISAFSTRSCESEGELYMSRTAIDYTACARDGFISSSLCRAGNPTAMDLPEFVSAAVRHHTSR
jgi:hypothetical protein